MFTFPFVLELKCFLANLDFFLFVYSLSPRWFFHSIPQGCLNNYPEICCSVWRALYFKSIYLLLNNYLEMQNSAHGSRRNLRKKLELGSPLKSEESFIDLHPEQIYRIWDFHLFSLFWMFLPALHRHMGFSMSTEFRFHFMKSTERHSKYIFSFLKRKQLTS